MFQSSYQRALVQQQAALQQQVELQRQQMAHAALVSLQSSPPSPMLLPPPAATLLPPHLLINPAPVGGDLVGSPLGLAGFDAAAASRSANNSAFRPYTLF